MGWKQKLLVSQLTSFYLIHRKAEKEESDVKSCIIIMDGQKVVKINPELEINHSQDTELVNETFDFKVQVDAN